MQIVGEDLHPIGQVKDFSPYVAKIKQSGANALAVAKWLEADDRVAWVNYPGLPEHPSHELAQKYFPKGQSGILGFGIKGGREAGKKFIGHLLDFKKKQPIKPSPVG